MQALGPGTVVLVVGPSGAGKDALIHGARALLGSGGRFVFMERHISRPPHAAEAHMALSEAAFAEACARGDYALTWAAHGLQYGIPVALDQRVREGCTAVLNASRTIIAAARQRYARVRIVLVDCDPEIRAVRLAMRGRESLADLRERLTRTVAGFDPAAVDARIDNSGSLEAGIDRFAATLRAVAADTPQPANG